MNIQRHAEIDLLRTIAIVMMVIFHAAYDLVAFYDWNIHLESTSWQALRITCVSLFLFVSGVSTNFSSKPLRRSMTVLGCALLISIATYVVDPHTFIRFGILHCIGAGMLCLIILKPLKEWNIPLGFIIIYFSLFIFHFQLPPPHLTLDYYPFIPWFGLMLLGAGIGHFIYIRKKMIINMKIPKILLLPGKNALLIYMIHQPILLGLLSLI